MSLYTGSKFEIVSMMPDRAELVFRRGDKAKLHLIITGRREDSHKLVAPERRGDMLRKIYENVSGTMQGTFVLKNGTSIEFEVPCAYEYNINPLVSACVSEQ
jgi:hypothetical protein